MRRWNRGEKGEKKGIYRHLFFTCLLGIFLTTLQHISIDIYVYFAAVIRGGTERQKGKRGKGGGIK